MRLVGASWVTIWANLGVVVIVPVVAAILMASVVVAITWSNFLQALAPGAPITPWRCRLSLGNGLWLGLIATLACCAVSQLGFMAAKH